MNLKKVLAFLAGVVALGGIAYFLPATRTPIILAALVLLGIAIAFLGYKLFVKAKRSWGARRFVREEERRDIPAGVIEQDSVDRAFLFRGKPKKCFYVNPILALLSGAVLCVISFLAGYGDEVWQIVTHVVLAALFFGCVAWYFFAIQKKETVECLYRVGWHALIAHGLLLLSFIPLGFVLIDPLYGSLAGLAVAALVYYTKYTGEDKLWVTINEGNAKFVMFGGDPVAMPWAFKGFAELAQAPNIDVDGVVDGTVLRYEELYTFPSCHSEEKLANLSEEERVPYNRGRMLVWYKRALTDRNPLQQIYISGISHPYFDDAQVNDLNDYHEGRLKKRKVEDAVTGDGALSDADKTSVIEFPYEIGLNQVFFTISGMEMTLAEARELVRRKQLMADIKEPEEQQKSQGAQLSQDDRTKLDKLREELREHEDSTAYKDVKGKFPAGIIDIVGTNYWSFISGFYMKYPGTQKRIRLQSDAVMHKKVGNHGIPARIRKLDKGDANLFGNYFYRGPRPFFRIHRYHFTWKSPADKKERDELQMDHMRLSDDVYEAILKGAEDNNQLRLDLQIWSKIRIVNPRLAMFRIEKWLENVKTIILTHYRQMVGGAVFADIYKEKNQYGSSWRDLLQMTISDPKGEDVERRYGVRILTIEVIDVTPTGASPENMDAAQAAKWLAERHAEAKIAEAKGEVERVTRVFDKVLSYGEQGLAMRYFEALETAAQGAGNTILFGSLESAVKNMLSSGTNTKLADVLVGLGLDGDKAKQLLDIVRTSEEEKRKEASSS